MKNKRAPYSNSHSRIKKKKQRSLAAEFTQKSFEPLDRLESIADSTHSTSPQLKEKSQFSYVDQKKAHYLYGFTNSEFLAFFGNLNSIEYVIVLTIIALLISANLNRFERVVVYDIFLGISNVMESLVGQDAFLKSLEDEKESDARNQALQTDFDYLYDELNRLQAEIVRLKAQIP